MKAMAYAQEPKYSMKDGSTSIQSLYLFAMACEGVPVVLMARSIQRALLAALPQVE
jgi:hypothetical protein